ncbi:hypothetical protein ABRP58_18860 [Pectobacterium aroidearum]|uniref:hypothetical protein n=1 Tax=Pectobacterium aroidearum TaxID=1201031 RepID=UPI0032EEA705
MAFIRITNDDHVTLVDSEVFNLSLSQKGSLSIGFVPEYGPSMTIIYTAKSELPPILALSCQTHHVSLLSTKKNGNTYTYTVIAIDTNGSQDIVKGKYFIFDSREPTTTGVGHLIIRNSEGIVTFDSDVEYLSVHSINEFAAYQNNSESDDIVYQLPPERVFAAVTNKISYFYSERYSAGELDMNWYYDGIKLSSGILSRRVSLFYSSSYQSGGGNFDRNGSDSEYMIVDVTGL